MEHALRSATSLPVYLAKRDFFDRLKHQSERKLAAAWLSLSENCEATNMFAMIWISQYALRFADADLCTTILFGLILMWIVVSVRTYEEGGVTGLFLHLITAFACLFTSTSFWNNNTQCQDEKKAMNPKKEKKKKKETPPPVLADDKKKKNKKNRRSQKKIVSKENKEPTIVKEKTKMYPSLELCQKLNRDAREVYELLMKFKLTESQLKMNNFPSEDYHPPTLVDVNDTERVCVRCSEKFDIFNGVYLCATLCKHHPRRATFSKKSHVKIYPCCNNPVGSDPCTKSNHHVTLQHRPRTMTKTASRRHIKKDLQYRIYGLDCEMSFTTDGLEVTRIGVVDIDGCTVYDSYVKPKNKILDYNTLYSGVEKRHLEHVKITIDDVKEILNGFIHEDTILVGHALNNDLAALGLIHNTVVDTSVLYGNPNCPMKKRSLKSLASEHLGMTIQDNPAGHDCIEDARACLQLALLKVPPSPYPAGHFIGYENFASARPWRQSLAERENFFYENENQQSSIGSREQQQPLMQLQNLYSYRNVATRAQQDQGNRYPCACNSYTPYAICNCEPFRYDPSIGCYRNYQIRENSFTL